MTKPDQFIDLPVEGDYTISETDWGPQKTKHELGEQLKAALAFSAVEAIRWNQYTPYWNDGDPCVFSVLDPYVKITGYEPEEDWMGEGFAEIYELTRINQEYDWNTHKYVDLPPEKQNHDIDPRLINDLQNLQIGDRCFYEVMLELFGDHAQVTVWNGKNIEIEFYEHD